MSYSDELQSSRCDSGEGLSFERLADGMELQAAYLLRRCPMFQWTDDPGYCNPAYGDCF